MAESKFDRAVTMVEEMVRQEYKNTEFLEEYHGLEIHIMNCLRRIVAAKENIYRLAKPELETINRAVIKFPQIISDQTKVNLKDLEDNIKIDNKMGIFKEEDVIMMVAALGCHDMGRHVLEPEERSKGKRKFLNHESRSATRLAEIWDKRLTELYPEISLQKVQYLISRTKYFTKTEEREEMLLKTETVGEEREKMIAAGSLVLTFDIGTMQLIPEADRAFLYLIDEPLFDVDLKETDLVPGTIKKWVRDWTEDVTPLATIESALLGKMDWSGKEKSVYLRENFLEFLNIEGYGKNTDRITKRKLAEAKNRFLKTDVGRDFR